MGFSLYHRIKSKCIRRSLHLSKKFIFKGLFFHLKPNLSYSPQCPCVQAIVQSCLTLCDSMDYSPPGSSVHGILWARILEWLAMPSSRGSSWPRDQTHVSCGSCISGGFFTAEPGSLGHCEASLVKLCQILWNLQMKVATELPSGDYCHLSPSLWFINKLRIFTGSKFPMKFGVPNHFP